MLQTIPKLLHLCAHSLICVLRKLAVNGPKYATTPEAIRTSPAHGSLMEIRDVTHAYDANRCFDNSFTS